MQPLQGMAFCFIHLSVRIIEARDWEYEDNMYDLFSISESGNINGIVTGDEYKKWDPTPGGVMDSAQDDQLAGYITPCQWNNLLNASEIASHSCIYQICLSIYQRAWTVGKYKKEWLRWPRILFFQQIATRKPKLNTPLHAGYKTGFGDGNLEISSTSRYNCGIMQSLLVHPTY
jgi:hypothetical protein